MSLSGNLGFVPIDEVLRLLTRSKQQGAVEVTGSGLRGRVFVGKGGIDIATTWDDDDLHRHLVNSGFAEESSLGRILAAETTLAAIAESNQPMIDLVREMTVESLYQIGHRGEDFEVLEGLTTPYASPKSFELESLLEDAGERRKDWGKVKEVVPNLATAINFRRDLGEREEVTVKVDDWKVLSEIGVGSSVSEIADHLGTTEFWTARVAARLVKSDLVILTDSGTTAPTPDRGGWEVDETPAQPDSGDDYVAAEDDHEDYPVEEHVAATDEEHVAVTDYEAVEYDEAVAAIDAETEAETEAEPAVETAVEVESSEDVFAVEEAESAEYEEDRNPNESWWQEPHAEEGDEEPSESAIPEVVSEDLAEMPSVEDDSDVEGDTEAFLEKVFSELESSESESGQESEPEPEEEGHGLLRRRRMGTLRDFSSDS